MPPVEGWAMMTVPASSLAAIEGDDDRASGRSMIALGRRLPDGKFLLVAENRYRAIKSKEATLIAMGWGIAATVLLGLLGGMLINAGFMRRIEDINRTSQAIVAGNLSNRVPTRGSGDEMDQLAVNLNAMLDRIQSLMESLKRVSDDVAHDLRTPLSRLRRRLEVASERAHAGADGTAVIEESIADVDAILETFAALLRIAQIESGTRRAAFAEVSLGQVASAVAETYTAVAEDRGQRVRADVNGSAVVHGDRELLTQMIANLMENSIRHSPAGTDVAVTLAMENGEAILGIADTGPGIPARERDNVLQRFYRLEASRTLPGSGLGLALVKAVVDLHGASLELLDNAPGLRVIVRFRAQRSAAARNGLAYPVPAESGATR